MIDANDDYRFKDKQDEELYYTCDQTRNNIYKGESYLQSPEGETIRDDFETLREHANYKRKIAGEEEI